MIKQKPL